MTLEVVLGLDAGTTSAKGVLVDRAGEVIAAASSEPIATEAPEPGASEQDPAAVRTALHEAIRRTMSAAGDHDVRAVAIAAQSGSVVPVVDDGTQPPFITWMDTRSEPVVSSWDASRRDEVRAISGWSVSPGLGLSTLSWLGAARPGIFERARRFASVDDHVAHALTGSWVTNPSNASGMQLMDVRRLDWSDSLCAMARVDPSRLSTIAPSGALLGRVQAEAAQQTGLAPGLPLVVGGHDQACAALGLGVVAPGAAFLSAGTAWVLTRVVDGTDVATIPTELNLSPHVVEGCWSASQNLGGIGAMLEWWRSQAGASHDDLAAAVDASSPSPDDPFFVLSLADPDRTDWGRFVPGDARSVGARTRAVIEAAAFEVRAALATMSEALGAMTTITIVGGATRNRHLVQAIADATDTPVVTREPASWPAVGAARLAADWLGWPILPTDHAGASSVRPDPSSVARRDDRFATHRRLNAGAPP